MNGAKLVSITWRVVLALLLVLPPLSAGAERGREPMVTPGRWADSFDDATGLEDLNQTLVNNGAVQLNGNAHQVWEINSQIDFQAGTLDQVDAEAVPGALQLAPAALSFNPNQLVSDTSYNTNFLPPLPALVSDGNQALHLAWVDSVEERILYRCSADAGQSWTSIEPLTFGGSTAPQNNPDLVVDSTGRVYAAWRDEENNPNGNIYLASRPGCGGSWNTPVTLTTTTGSVQDEPSLAIDDEDGLYLAWVADEDIYFSYSDDGGQSWRARQKLNDESGLVASTPDVVVDPTGQKVLVVWAYGPDGTRSIYFTISNDGGQTWSTNVPVTIEPTQSQEDPTVARAISGELYVAWANAGGSGGVYISRSLDGGQTWEAAVRVDDPGPWRVWGGTSLTVDNRGTIYLAWHDKRNITLDFKPYFDIFMDYSRDGGQSWNTDILVNDDQVPPGIGNEPIDHLSPSVAVNQVGQFFAAWWDERGMCCDPGTPQKVYFVNTAAHLFAPNGNFTSAVHDAIPDTGGPVTWDTIEWTATTPANTNLAVRTRSGDTPQPDISWSDWSPAYLTSGEPINSPSAGYIQVQAILSTTNPLTTPILDDITLHYRPFVWEQTTQTDFAQGELQNVDVTTISGTVRLLPDVVFAPEQRVNDDVDKVAQTNKRPALAAVGDLVYLAWRDIRNNDSEGDIFFARSTDGGQTWSANIQINDDPPGARQNDPYLVAENNDVYLVWHDEREGGEGDIYFARSMDGGQSWGPNMRVNGNTISVVGDPAVATGAGARLHVTWATSKTLIYANRSIDAGQSWQGNVPVGSGDSDNHFFSGYPAPGIATNGSGDVYVAWQAFKDNQGGTDRLRAFASRSIDNGSSWGADVRINVEGNDTAVQQKPQLAYDNGKLYVVWANFHNSSPLNDPDLYFARSLDGGQSWSASTQVNTNEILFNTPDPIIAVDSGGVVYASWRGDHLDSVGDIFFKRSLDGGNTWQVERRVNTDPAGGRQDSPALFAGAAGRVYLAWPDERDNEQNLYFTTALTGITYTSGTLISRILDTDGAAQWGNIAWTATTPPSTTLTLYTRSGNTTNPDDGTWSNWSTAYTSSPAPISSPLARYIQYRVDLATTDPYTTPVLYDVSLEYGHYPLQGSAVSVPISPPTGFGEWQTVTFNGTTPPPGTTLNVDVLDREGNILLENVSSGTSLANYSPAQYPSLRLRVKLTTNNPTVTPTLNEWALTWRPPPAEDHVRVINESEEPAGDTDVYYNGTFLGTTDHLGLLDLPGPPQVGDTLSAIQPLTETLTIRDAHDGWAYRTYITNIGLDAQGIPHTFTVNQAGAQTLTVHTTNTLVLFNIVVSVEWDATDEYLAMLEDAFRKASAYLYDVTDGQMAFGQVTIYDRAQYWADADFQFSTKNIVRPYAFVGGITSSDEAHTIRVGRFWDGGSGNNGHWNEPPGYRTLIHEFGHYALYLYDEYFFRLVDANGFSRELDAFCTDETVLDNDKDATNASLMFYQYNASELADKTYNWGQNCTSTEQYRLNNGQSDWETVLNYYDGPDWVLNTPSERGYVMAGPEAFPTQLLPLPTVVTSNSGKAGPSRQLTVLNPHSQPAHHAVVALYTIRDNDTIAIDQGLTDSQGQIAVYGAVEGDTIRAATFDGALTGGLAVGSETSYQLKLTPSGAPPAPQWGEAPMQADGSPPYLNLIPGTEGDTLTLRVQGTPANSPPLDAVVIPGEGGGSPQHTSLVPSPSEGGHVGTVSLSGVGLGTGQVRVSGDALPSALNSDYNLQQVRAITTNHLYSEDGNFELHIPPEGVPADGYTTVLPTGYVPGPLPAGKQVIGSAYEVRLSGALAELDKAGLVRLHYHPAVMGVYTDTAIYYWDAYNTVWLRQGGESSQVDNARSVPASRLGIYALMGVPVAGADQVYLPIVVKE